MDEKDSKYGLTAKEIAQSESLCGKPPSVYIVRELAKFYLPWIPRRERLFPLSWHESALAVLCLPAMAEKQLVNLKERIAAENPDDKDDDVLRAENKEIRRLTAWSRMSATSMQTILRYTNVHFFLPDTK